MTFDPSNLSHCFPSRQPFTTTIFAGLALLAAVLTGPAHADLRDDIARCAGLADDTARLACFDAAATDMQNARNAAGENAAAALSKEFRFDVDALTGPLSLRVNARGNLRTSRDTVVAREVETIVRRINMALTGIDGWSLSLVVHGGKVTLSRGSPYSGGELLAQARTGLARSGLPKNRYTTALGEDAEPEFWDDGRIRSANEHIDIQIVGLGATASR